MPLASAAGGARVVWDNFAPEGTAGMEASLTLRRGQLMSLGAVPLA